jgi:hypothetical protein
MPPDNLGSQPCPGVLGPGALNEKMLIEAVCCRTKVPGIKSKGLSFSCLLRGTHARIIIGYSDLTH